MRVEVLNYHLCIYNKMINANALLYSAKREKKNYVKKESTMWNTDAGSINKKLHKTDLRTHQVIYMTKPFLSTKVHKNTLIKGLQINIWVSLVKKQPHLSVLNGLLRQLEIRSSIKSITSRIIWKCVWICSQNLTFDAPKT